MTRGLGSEGERSLETQMRMVGIRMEREYRFVPERRWRFDFARPDLRLAVEVEGGQWRGGHVAKGRFEEDMEKYNEAAILGWAVIRVSTGMVDDGRALDVVQKAMLYLIDKEKP